MTKTVKYSPSNYPKKMALASEFVYDGIRCILKEGTFSNWENSKELTTEEAIDLIEDKHFSFNHMFYELFWLRDENDELVLGFSAPGYIGLV